MLRYVLTILLLASNCFAQDTARMEKEITVSQDILNQYVGTYRVTPDINLTVTLEDKQLMIQPADYEKYPLSAISENKFFLEAANTTVEFFKDDKGIVSHLISHQGGSETAAKRTGYKKEPAPIDGTWIATVNGPDGNPLEAVYIFEALGKALIGTVNTELGGGPFSEGKVDGDKISFVIRYGEAIIEWNGTVSGDVINMIQKNGDDVKKYTIKRFSINSSTTAFSVSEKDLSPEGITYDPVGKAFYLSSTYKSKIIKIDNKGNRSDFTKERQDGLRSVLGMKVDPKNRSLWACSVVTNPKPKNFNPDEMGWSGLFKYNIDTGLLQKKYTLHEPGKPHLFNDLVVLDNEDVYVTDSTNAAIYKINAKDDKLELFLNSDLLNYTNGIALSDDRKSLFVASGAGIVKIDIESRAVRHLDQTDNVITSGIDGLYLYNNSLVGVQGWLNRIIRFYLDPEETGLLRSEILEIGNPQLNSPTTGVIVGNSFYFIANSQLNSLNRDSNIFPEEQLEEVLVFEMTLDK